MNMKIAHLIGCALAFVVLGCKHEPQSAPPQPAAKTVSDGSHTWMLGATTMNGTNVPLSDIQVRASTNQPSQ
jgi:hypothetical protein